MREKKLLFVGGGSGGHIIPNVALIEYLLAQRYISKDNILYIGSKTGMEGNIVSAHGIRYHAISSGKLRRYFDWHNFIDIFKIIAGIWQSFFVIRAFQPDVIFSKGGFVSVPVVIGGWLNRVPIITHESDIVAGLANRIIKRFATKICLTFPKTSYHRKEVLTGLPLREALLHGTKEEGYRLTGLSPHKPVLLVMGGSLGASVLNHFVWDNVQKMLETTQIIHIVGKGNTREMRQEGYIQYEFIDAELPHMYAISDVVLSRAGATVIVECAVLGKPIILVPLTTKASRGEQERNAKFLEQQQAAVILPEKNLYEQGLFLIKHLLADEMRRKELSHHIHDLFPLNASERIRQELDTVLTTKQKGSC